MKALLALATWFAYHSSPCKHAVRGMRTRPLSSIDSDAVLPSKVELTFDDIEASKKTWVRKAVETSSSMNRDTERELRRRHANTKLRLSGPRTFMLTVGGMASGKSYALKQIMGGKAKLLVSLAASDFVAVDPDGMRQTSQAFQKITSTASGSKLPLPKNLITDKHLFKAKYGRKKGHHADWLFMTRQYMESVVLPKVFNPKGRTSVIYDSSCGHLGTCAHLLERAVVRGAYERLIVLFVDVPLQCSMAHALSRAGRSGRWTSSDVVRSSHKTATANGPALMKKAFTYLGKSRVKSIMTIHASGSGANDSDGCFQKTQYTSKETHVA